MKCLFLYVTASQRQVTNNNKKTKYREVTTINPALGRHLLSALVVVFPEVSVPVRMAYTCVLKTASGERVASVCSHRV